MNSKYVQVKAIIVMSKFGRWSGWTWVSDFAWTWAISLLGLDVATSMLDPQSGWVWREQ